MTDYIRIDDDFEPEIVPERVIWLDDEQFDLLNNLVEKLRSPGLFELHFVLGVAGTGKTQVLLSLASELRELGQSVFLGLSNSLTKSLTDAGFQINPGSPTRKSIHIVDDPTKVADIKAAIKLAKNQGARALVVGIDPFQWTERKALLQFAAFLDPKMGDSSFIESSSILTRFRDVDYTARPVVHWLRTVYRQSGKTASGALALSKALFERKNPYVYPHKQAEFDSFTQPLMSEFLERVKVGEEAGEFFVSKSSAGTSRELWNQVAKHMSRTDRWSWTDALLVVPQAGDMESKWSHFKVEIPGLSDQDDFDPEISFAQISEFLPVRIASVSMPESVRGEEFQDVVVSLSESHWSFLESTKGGLDSRKWAMIMPLHTFITRATDSIRIFIGKAED